MFLKFVVKSENTESLIRTYGESSPSFYSRILDIGSDKAPLVLANLLHLGVLRFLVFFCSSILHHFTIVGIHCLVSLLLNYPACFGPNADIV